MSDHVTELAKRLQTFGQQLSPRESLMTIKGRTQGFLLAQGVQDVTVTATTSHGCVVVSAAVQFKAGGPFVFFSFDVKG